MVFGWRIIRISGDSMEPKLGDGDYVLIKRVKPPHLPNTGQIIYIDHPHLGKIVKCLGEETKEGTYQIYGLSVKSTMRVDLGTIKPDDILARVIWRFSPGYNGLVK